MEVLRSLEQRTDGSTLIIALEILMESIWDTVSS